MKRRLTFMLWIMLAAPWAFGATPKAEDIVGETGVGAGLCVVVSGEDADLAIDLAERGGFLVHCLLPSRELVGRARAAVRAKGVYGRVSVDRLPADGLPYAENLVSLLAVDGGAAPPEKEIMRVLSPRGVAWLGDGRKLEKPWPDAIDEWTHWLHGADGNAVANDSVVGPVKHLQWIEEPVWQRHHELTASPSVVVSSKGRLFYICDEAGIAISGMPDRWCLIARDAFNGILLWKRPIEDWGWRAWFPKEVGGRFMVPIHISRRMVAVGDRVYVTLGFNAPLTALDAATGKTVKTYQDTDFTDEIMYHDGLLVLSVNKGKQEHGRIAKVPPVKKDVVVLKADTGEVLWRKGEFSGVASKSDALERITHLSLAVNDGGVFLVEEDAVVGLNLKTGDQMWRSPRPEKTKEKGHVPYRPPNLCTLVVYEDVVLFAQPEEPYSRKTWNRGVKTVLTGLSAKTGKPLWSHGCGKWGPGVKADVFVINGLVWAHDAGSHCIIGLDPRTGEVKKKHSTKKAFDEVHHHRCYRDKATVKYLLTARRGIEFLDLETGENHKNHWVRGTCRHGIVPCNGLVYSPPHPCKCYVQIKVNGFHALAPARTSGRPAEILTILEKGPALGSTAKKQTAGVGWPTYRADMRRSGSTKDSVPSDLKLMWKTKIGGSPSACTVSGGKVFTASIDEHRVCALDAGDGSELWSFTAGGRVDTPPSVYNGTALFGSRDGWIYCLRVSDGALAWRFRAAPEERRVVAFGQLESPWPVHGTVLVKDGVAYAAAGRSTYLDGGIRVCALEPATGKLIRDLEPLNKRSPHGLADVLTSDGTFVFMRHLKYSLEGKAAGKKKKGRKGARSGPRAYSTGGLLDDSWFARVGWSVGGGGKGGCELLVFDENGQYGVIAYSKQGFGGLHTPGKKGYTVAALGKSAKKKWNRKVTIRPVAMVLAGDVLFAAGFPDAVDKNDPWAAFDGRKGGKLLALSAADGKPLAKYDLDAPPVYDGMSGAGGRLYISTTDGNVLCFAGK